MPKTTNWESMKVAKVREFAPELGVDVRDSKGKLKKKKDLIHEMRTAYWKQVKKS